MLEHLEDYKIARIVILTKGKQFFPVDCLARSTTPPFLEAVFPPGQLAVEEIDLTGKCRVTYEVNGQGYAFNASIERMVDDTRLGLVALETVNHERRRHFRVDTKTSLEYRRLTEPEDALPRELHEQLNLSGGGIRFRVAESLALKERLALKISLDGSLSAPVECVGEVVRLFELKNGGKGVALRMIEIGPKDQDRIIAFCFAEQRKNLRNKVRVLDPDRS